VCTRHTSRSVTSPHAAPLDSDTGFEGEALAPEERDNEDPAPAAP